MRLPVPPAALNNDFSMQLRRFGVAACTDCRLFFVDNGTCDTGDDKEFFGARPTGRKAGVLPPASFFVFRTTSHGAATMSGERNAAVGGGTCPLCGQKLHPGDKDYPADPPGAACRQCNKKSVYRLLGPIQVQKKNPENEAARLAARRMRRDPDWVRLQHAILENFPDLNVGTDTEIAAKVTERVERLLDTWCQTDARIQKYGELLVPLDLVLNRLRTCAPAETEPEAEPTPPTGAADRTRQATVDRPAIIQLIQKALMHSPFLLARFNFLADRTGVTSFSMLEADKNLWKLNPPKDVFRGMKDLQAALNKIDRAPNLEISEKNRQVELNWPK